MSQTECVAKAENIENNKLVIVTIAGQIGKLLNRLDESWRSAAPAAAQERSSNTGATVIHATLPGQEAADCADAECSSGPVGAAIVAALQSGNITVAKLFDLVNAKVVEITQGRQIPYIEASSAIEVPLVGEPGRSFALVIGNGNYAHIPALKGSPRDAKAVGSALERAGFETRILVDPDADLVAKSTVDFFRKLRVGDAALLYYSGHGFSMNGARYLPPLDGQPNNPDALIRSSTAVANLVDEFSRSSAVRKVLILDTHYPRLQPPNLR